jgi:hypothetical protein
MTSKDDEMTLEGDHYERISRCRLTPFSPARYTKYYMHIDELFSVSMKLLISISILEHNRYLHNYQSNVYLIKYNLVQQNMSVSSRIGEYLENKVTYINIQEINYMYSSYNQHAYLFILHVY